MSRPHRLLALAAALLVAGAAAPAALASPLLLGIQDDALLTSAESGAWPLAQRLGVRVVRYNVAWNAVAPTRPANPNDPGDAAYRFAAVDALVQHATAIGARPLLSLVQAPGWANGHRAPAVVPRRPADYASFCRAVARRYSGRYVPEGADAPLPEVDRYTVWNEPNRGQYLRPQGRGGLAAARAEALLVRACTGPVHGANPRARVALGPIASRGAQGGLAPLAFLDAYRHAGGPRPEVVAVNPYLERLAPVYRPDEHRADGAVTLRNLNQLEAALRADYHRRVPLWLTEFGLRVGPVGDGTTITPARQARLARQSVELVRKHYPYAELLVWFLLRDETPAGYWRTGLVQYDWAPKPIFGVWRAESAR